MARKITNLLLLGAAVGAVGWQVASRGPDILSYWRNVARVRRAERWLEKGEQLSALQLLGQAGQPGEARLGQLLVASHNKQNWAQLVSDLRRSRPGTSDAVAGTLTRSPEERLCAAEALAALGDQRGIRVLAWSLAAPSEWTHNPADLLSLGKAGCEALVNVARLGPRKARERAILILSDPQVPEAKWALLGLATDEGFAQRSLAVRALEPYDGEALDTILQAFARVPDPKVRAEATRQCGRRGGAKALPTLGEALDDPDSRVRLAAVDALCAVEGRDADRLLIRALADDDSRVVRCAARSLGRRHAEEAAPALAELYPHASRGLKRDIAMALCWMGSPLAPEYTTLWEQETGQQLPLSSAWDG